jgi:hypothetical protein
MLWKPGFGLCEQSLKRRGDRRGRVTCSGALRGAPKPEQARLHLDMAAPATEGCGEFTLPAQ